MSDLKNYKYKMKANIATFFLYFHDNFLQNNCKKRNPEL